MATSEFHTERQGYIGGSDVAVLFGLYPWKGTFTLYHEKKGNIETDAGNNRTEAGTRLEGAIGQWIADINRWPIRKPEGTDYHARVKRMAAKCDFYIDPCDDFPTGGVLEIKNVDAIAYKRSWIDDDGNERPPIYYLLQLQHQLACTGLDKGAIGVLVGGNEPKTFVYERHQPTIDVIEQRVVQFWADFDADKAPNIDYQATDVINRMWRSNGQCIHREGDAEVEALMVKLMEAKQARKCAETDFQIVQNHLKAIMAENETMVTSNYICTFKEIVKEPHEVKGTRYRLFTVRERKEVSHE